MINAASSRLQTNQVIESKNTSFTMTHLVLKKKRSAQQDWKWEKNDWTFTMSTFIPTHQRAKVRQRSSLVCSSLQVFSRCNSIFPGVILALLLHGLFSFNYVHCKLDLLLARTARQSDRHRRARAAGFQSVKIDRTASLLKLRSTISLCSTIYWQFHLWLGKGKCEESSVLGEHEKGRSGCYLDKALDEGERKLGCLRHRWAKRLRPDVLWSPIHWPKTNQWSPFGIIVRN